MEEEASIKFMLLLFCGTYVLRVGFATLFHFNEEWLYDLYQNDNNLFCLSVLLLWITWDAVPMLSIVLAHYRNFKSFSDGNFVDVESSFQQYDYLDSDFEEQDSNGVNLHRSSSNQRYNGLLETNSIIQVDSEESESMLQNENNANDREDGGGVRSSLTAIFSFGGDKKRKKHLSSPI